MRAHVSRRPQAAYTLATFVEEQLLQNSVRYSPIIPFGPMKAKQLELTEEAFSHWPPPYNRTDVAAFLTATRLTVSHPNTILDLK